MTLNKLKYNAELSVFVGREAILLCSDPEFQACWDTLYNACSWATIFQSRAFVTTWFTIYQLEYLPIIIKAEHNGALLGLLTVAKDKNQLITGAGADQAEYQVWLSTKSYGEIFIVDALRALSKSFPKSDIRLQYIKSDAPLKWTIVSAFGRKRCFLQRTKHYFVQIKEDYILKKLKNPGRRNKINRLKRLGELNFERITDPVLFDSIYDQLAILSDFRKGAMFNKFYFGEDSLRKQFLTTLLRQNILHVSALLLNNDVIASNVGLLENNGKVMYSGINSHAPSYAKNSPGILHFLFLSKQLCDEGVEVLDLGPGDNFYKEELGSDYTTGYTLFVSNLFQTFLRKVTYRIIRQVKTIATSVGVKASFLRRLKTNADIGGLPSMIKSWVNKVLRKKRALVFKVKATRLQSSVPQVNIQKDSLNNLLTYKPSAGREMPKWRFLSEAKNRLEDELHCYTWTEHDQLLGCVWIKNIALTNDEHSTRSDLTGTSVLLEGLYCHSSSFKKINEFLGSVALHCGSEEVYIEVSEPAFCKALKTAGFVPLKKHKLRPI